MSSRAPRFNLRLPPFYHLLDIELLTDSRVVPTGHVSGNRLRRDGRSHSVLTDAECHRIDKTLEQKAEKVDVKRILGAVNALAKWYLSNILAHGPVWWRRGGVDSTGVSFGSRAMVICATRGCGRGKEAKATVSSADEDRSLLPPTSERL